MKNSFYFDHDYNARNDQKILELRAEFDWLGYGIYFAILESLCESNGYLKREALSGLSLGLSLPKDRLLLILEFCINIKLFSESKEGIFSKRILDHLEYRKKLSEAGKLGGRGNKKPPFNHPLATPEAGKESKGEYSKEKKRNKDILDFYFLPEFKSLLNDWFEYKLKRKESYKDSKSRERFYKMLLRYSNSSIDRATFIIDKSMSNNWAGIFELKSNELIPILKINKDIPYISPFDKLMVK